MSAKVSNELIQEQVDVAFRLGSRKDGDPSEAEPEVAVNDLSRPS